jgi:hypothetical protein
MSRLLKVLTGLLSPIASERERAADESTDEQWDGIDLLLVCRALARSVLSESDIRCREAQLHALVQLNLDELQARIELQEIVEKLPLDIDGHVAYLRGLVEGKV